MPTLDLNALNPDPFLQFAAWFKEACDVIAKDPNAMTLATSTPGGRPSARTVLMKEFGYRGFVFFSNYLSRKGQELVSNPDAALLFYWRELDKQVRVEGRVERVSAEESDAYFYSRPLGSRISAAISPQSRVIPGRHFLVDLWNEKGNSLPSQPLVRPSHWGGYLLVPWCFEFWQAGDNRLHYRFRYLSVEGGWRIEQLAP
jgi:pyridoxamine 5'-phosphate oxidase